MAYSSILGGERAPIHPSGKGADLLGPSDNSDSGSDSIGTGEINADSDAAGTGERGSVTPGDTHEGADILPDRVVRLGGGEDPTDVDLDGQEFTDLDPDEPGDDDPAR